MLPKSWSLFFSRPAITLAHQASLISAPGCDRCFFVFYFQRSCQAMYPDSWTVLWVFLGLYRNFGRMGREDPYSTSWVGCAWYCQKDGIADYLSVIFFSPTAWRMIHSNLRRRLLSRRLWHAPLAFAYPGVSGITQRVPECHCNVARAT